MDSVVVGESVPDDCRLWRYLSLDKLIDLLDTRTLFLAPLKLMRRTDPFEGYMPKVALRALASVFATQCNEVDQARSQLEGYFRATGQLAAVETRLSQLRANLDGMDAFAADLIRSTAERTTVSCWHQSSIESEAMWKLYSDSGKGVAIVSSPGSIRKSLKPENSSGRLYVGKVRYLDFHDEDLKPAECVVDGHLAPLLKRLSYQHEKEVRIFTTPETDYREALAAPARPVRVPIDPDILIDEVYISPFAGEPFATSTRAVCRAFGLDSTKVTASSMMVEGDYLADGVGEWRKL